MLSTVFYANKINIILLLYIILEIIEELIILRILLISTTGAKSVMTAKIPYINNVPFKRPYKKPIKWFACFINGNFAIKSPENLKKNRIILVTKKTAIIQAIWIIVLATLFAMMGIDAVLTVL